MSTKKTETNERKILLNGLRQAYHLARRPIEIEDDGKIIHDRITAANASTFVETYYSEPLTQFAIGWRDTNNIEETLEFMAPGVPVNRRFEYAVADNAEEFFSDALWDDQRALRGDFKEVEYRGDMVQARTYNHGLKIHVDTDEIAEKANWKEARVQKLIRRLLRNSLRRAVAIHQAVSVNTNVTWSTGVVDPDAAVNNLLITASDASGVRPNRVVYGDMAWGRRLLGHRAQNTAGGTASAGMTADQLAGWLQVDGVHVSRERWTSSLAGKSQVVGNQVFAFFAESGMDTEDSSNLKRFWSPCQNGKRFQVYERQVNTKIWEIAVELHELIAVTSPIGWNRLTVS